MADNDLVPVLSKGPLAVVLSQLQEIKPMICIAHAGELWSIEGISIVSSGVAGNCVVFSLGPHIGKDSRDGR